MKRDKRIFVLHMLNKYGEQASEQSMDHWIDYHAMYRVLGPVIRHVISRTDQGEVVAFDLHRSKLIYDGSISYVVPELVEYYDSVEHALFVLNMRRSNGEFD